MLSSPKLGQGTVRSGGGVAGRRGARMGSKWTRVNCPRRQWTCTAPKASKTHLSKVYQQQKQSARAKQRFDPQVFTQSSAARRTLPSWLLTSGLALFTCTLFMQGMPGKTKKKGSPFLARGCFHDRKCFLFVFSTVFQRLYVFRNQQLGHTTVGSG